MDGLIELVAASFARHGIECPIGDSQPPIGGSQPMIEGSSAQAARPAEPAMATLPEHNYRRSLPDDPAKICL